MYKLVKKLVANNIHLSVDNGNLKVKFDGKKLPQDLLSQIKANKEALIAYFSQEDDGAESRIEIAAANVSYPLSSAQKRLWILNQVDPGAVAYNMAGQTMLDGSYNLVNFERAINATIAHHEILRTVFRVDENKEARQWILAPEEINFTISHEDLRSLEEADQQEKVTTYIQEDSVKSFDLEKGPLLRATLLQVADDQFVFYYNMHHIISDGVSMNNLAKNIVMAYNAIEAGEEAILPALRIQYKDYAVWQLAQLESEASKADKNFWLNQLAGELPTLNLPATKKRPKIQTTNGKNLATYINKDTVQQFKALCQQENGSLFMGLIAVLNVLFYRYTNQKDFIVGTPIAGRDNVDLENQIGFYVNTLALRNTIESEQSFKDVFTNVKKNTLEAYAHQAYPFNQLIQDLGLKRDVSRSAIFDVMVTMHNFDNSTVNLQVNENEVGTIVDYGAAQSKFDLELNFKEVDGYIYVAVIYNEDVYEGEMISNFMKHFQSVLEAATKVPTEKIGQLDILQQTELATLEAFNATDVTYNEAKNVVDLFAAQVAKNPNKTALVYEGKKLTFRELDEKSNQVANYIETLNLTNTLIPTCVDRSFEMIIGIWGILKSGNAYVPVDPTYPQDRIDYILDDTQVSLVFCNTVYTAFFENVRVVDLDTFDYNSFATTSPNVSISEDQLAYCIYTSGTTGKPKGVLNAHAGLANRLFWMRDDLNITADSVLFHKTPYVFDVSVWELTMPFIVGCPLVIARPEGHLDPEYLQDTIEREGVTFIHFVPSMLNVFIDVASAEKLQSLTHIVCSGEALSAAVTEKTKQLLTTPEIVNLYGPTEAAIDVTSMNLRAIDTEKEGVSIGRPAANTKIYVVNTDLQLQPVGVIGELLIGGIQVANGYVNKPELTAQKFIKNPFQAEGNVYRTGDLVRWLPNGTLDFLGRKDDQVKINGYRVELGEVTNAIENLENVKQAVVVVDEVPGSKRLLAYFVAENELTREGIQKELKGKLPEYMIPVDFMQLDTIPLTINGKVNRKALPAFLVSETETTNYVAPRNEKEEIIATIWQDVLGIETIGVNDNFFSLGGDSIIAIQFISKAKKQGITLKVKDVFEFQTIDELATKVNHEIQIISEQGILEGNFGLLPIQSYFFEKGYTKDDQYNQSLLLTLPKNITRSQLNEAVAGVYQKHDILRARFELVNDELVGTYETTIPEISEETITATEAVGEAVTKVCAYYQETLNTTEGTVARFVLINTPESEAANRVFIVAHHLVIDGVSWRIIADDLTANLQKVSKGETVSIGEKTTSFRQWQERLATYANSETLNEEFAYWKSITEKIETLPQDTDFDGKTTYQGVDSYNVSLSKELTTSLLKESNQAFSTEIDDLLLAALAMSFSTWTNNDNLVIGLEGHGREDLFNDVDITETVGWFTSLYPVLLENFQDDVEATIVQAKENLKAIPNKGIGYGALRYLAADESKRESLHKDIEQVIFNYLGQADQGSSETASLFNFTNEGKGEDIHPENEYGGKITINSVITNGTLSLRWDYDTNRFAKESIETLAENYIKALETVVNFCKSQTETVATPADYGLNGLLPYQDLRVFKATMNAEEIEDIYQLSPMQEGMLFYSLLNKDSNAYINQISLDLTGEFNLENFKSAWKQIIQKHSILRTSFHLEGLNIPVQCVHKSAALPITVLDYTTKDNVEAAVTAFANEDASTAFEMDKAPLFRITLIKQAEDSIKLIYSTHHIISDGWSTPVIFGEYLENYQALAAGKTIATDEVDNYKEYITHITAKNNAEVVNYWKNQLSTLTLPSLLPFTDTTKNLNKTFGNTSMVLSKGKEYVMKLEAFAKKNRLTVNTVIQGVWAYLLSQYTNNETVVFGTVISGRPTEIKDIEKRLGLYINTIPLCTSITQETNIVSWLTDIQSNYAVSREEYGHSSLVDIQKQNNVARELFDSLLVFENYPLDAIEEAESDVVINNLETKQQNNYVLTISIRHVFETGMNVEYEYNSEILSNEIITMMKGHFDTLLEAIVKSEAISDLEYLSSEETALLLDTVNNVAPKNNSELVLNKFNSQVAKTPNKVAISFKDETFTYKELDEKSNQLANCLVNDHRIKNGDVIGIKLDRSNWVLISILGILKTGAAYVPIDPAYGSSREEHILSDANLSLLITESSYMFDMFDFDGNMLTVDIDFEADEFSTVFEATGITEETVAYMIYTSGSTGKPKGVLIQHGALANYLDWGTKQYLTENTLENCDFGLYTSLSFDLTVTSLFLPIVNGGTLHIYDQGDISQTLTSYLNSEISCIKLTPAHITLLKELDIEQSAVAVAIVGGDTLLPHHVETLRSINPNMKIYNEYGPTEATVGCMVFEVTSKDEITIGKAIQNTEIFVLNRNNQLVPNGVSGEICVGGAGLAKGYLNREDLTAEKFIPHPYVQGKRLYRTGDIGTWLADGNLAYLGRQDDQVKIRGYRIELGEIEQQLLNKQSIQEAVVLTHTMENGEKQLVAYLAFEEKEDTAMNIRKFLAESLPAYMIPAHFVPVNRMPLTVNGKINKEELVNLKDVKLDGGSEYVAPQNEIEAQVAKIWEKDLDIDTISIRDDYFHLGGDSIKMIRCISFINKEFDVEIPVATFYENPTIEGVAAYISEIETVGQETNTEKAIVEAEIEAIAASVLAKHPAPENVENVYPISDVQMGMVLTSQIARGKGEFGVYHDQFLFQLGMIDIPTLTHAMELMVKKHETLRTSYHLYEYDHQVQIIHKTVPVNIGYEDISKFDKEAKEVYIENFLVTQRTQYPFNTTKAPIWRINVFQIGVSDVIFVLQFHHAMIDGWGQNNFKVELFETYDKLSKDSTYVPAALQCSIKDSVVSDMIELRKEDNRIFWQDKMADYKRLEILNEIHSDEKYEKIYTEAYTSRIIEKCKQDQVTPKALFLGAYLYALSVLSSNSETTIGLVAHKRPIVEDGDKLLGCFLNSIPFRYDFVNTKEKTWLQYIKDVEIELNTLKGKDRFPLNEIADLLGENSQENPFFDILFNYINFHVLDELHNNEEFQTKQAKREVTDLAFGDFEKTNTYIDFTLERFTKNISITLTQSRAFKSGHTLEDIAGYFENFLANYLEKDQQGVNTERIFSREERTRLLELAEGKVLEIPSNLTFTSLFEAQVQKTPNMMAIVFDNSMLTYRQLDEVSNALAQFLVKEYGVTRNDVIGIQLDRSEWVIIAILAILKSGATYVPIDIEYPASRIEYIQEDSNCKLTITKETLEKFVVNRKNYKTSAVTHQRAPEDIMYIIYTSGSTGKPKGVMIQDRAILNTILTEIKTLGMDEGLRMLQFASFSFDASIWESFTTLLSGSTLFIAHDALRKNPKALATFIEEKHIDITLLPPAYLNLMDISKLGGLKTLFTGGEAPIIEDVKTFLELRSGKYYNAYGPSEASVYATTHYIESIDDFSSENITSGIPIANVSIYLLNDVNQLQSLGTVGEICIGGAGLAKGYLNRPGLTKERFIPHPFKENQLLYKTGDLGKWLSNGQLEFHGRKDDQVKIRGYRIELGEVEHRLLERETINEAIAMVVEDTDGGKKLVVYFTSNQEEKFSELRQELQDKLPAYMIPDGYVQIDVMPLTINGKIDKKQLLKLQGTHLLSVEYVAPRDEMEARIVVLWQEILKRDRIGVKDSFFEIGGNSLKAIQLISRIQKEYNVNFEMMGLYETPTVEALKEKLENVLWVTNQKVEDKENIESFSF
jgi:amino acid adenylation domain-containing protein/non-ribosomal peptide synthase protein (TIGR01720 family)